MITPKREAHESGASLMPDNTIDALRQKIANLDRELADSRAERDEALAQQSATAEVLRVINSSLGDLAPVFDAMLERAVRVCELDFSNLWTFDGSAFHPVARHGVDERFWQYLQGHTPPTFGPVLAGEGLVHIPDLHQLTIYMESNFGREARELGLDIPRSLLIVPLRKDDALLGVIVAYRREVRPFSDKQIGLVQNFAAQAVIAMENARLLGELRARTSDLQESLEYQTATSDVLGVISRSGGEVERVLQTLVETAARICAADTSAVTLLRDGRYNLAAAFGVSDEWTDFARHHPVEANRGTITGRVALEGRIIHVEDLADDPDYTMPQAQQLGAFRTALGVPLMRDGTAIGVIALARLRVEPFTGRQIELVRTFADQAVIAMENARLITETREALEQQTATAEVLGVINASPGDLAPVFDAMLDKALDLCTAAFGTLWTFDGECFQAVALRRVPAEFANLLSQSPYRPEPGSGHEHLLRGAPYVEMEDVAATPGIGPVRRALIELGGARTVIAVPLLKDGAVLGAISAYRQEVRPFTDKQIALLQNFAAQAVIAMENARRLGVFR